MNYYALAMRFGTDLCLHIIQLVGFNYELFITFTSLFNGLAG